MCYNKTLGSSLVKQKQALLQKWIKTGIITDSRVLDAFATTARENFVSKMDRDRAYIDCALPLICSQSISQPTTVMVMTQALKADEGMKILEVGAGSGYQSAILSAVIGDSGNIISIEYHEKLAVIAHKNLEKADCTNVKVVHGDGGYGWEEEAPYDRIIITCACPVIPPPLLDQLITGGIMVLPLKRINHDEIQVITKTASGLRRRSIGSFVFVPLRGRYQEHL
jgi:protein-L-isoaspartate(D-aspartate) O-methyltransferase